LLLAYPTAAAYFSFCKLDLQFELLPTLLCRGAFVSFLSLMAFCYWALAFAMAAK
jgi:hypothetical protein